MLAEALAQPWLAAFLLMAVIAAIIAGLGVAIRMVARDTEEVGLVIAWSAGTISLWVAVAIGVVVFTLVQGDSPSGLGVGDMLVTIAVTFALALEESVFIPVLGGALIILLSIGMLPMVAILRIQCKMHW